jgi:hypothetical protein
LELSRLREPYLLLKSMCVNISKSVRADIWAKPQQRCGSRLGIENIPDSIISFDCEENGVASN